MLLFSRDDVRERKAGPTGTVAISLKHDFQAAKARNGLASSASHFLSDSVECLLAGLDELADPLLSKAQQWLEDAIKNGEMPRRYVANRTEQRRHADLALCNWLLRNKHDQVNLEHAVRYLEFGLENATTNALSGMLVWAFPIYLEAGEYSRIISRCEKHNLFPLPPEHAGLDVGDDTGVMCRILAHHRLGLGYSEADVTAALNSYLPSAMERCVNVPTFDLIARWMKIVYWRAESRSPTARESILRSLSYLDG